MVLVREVQFPEDAVEKLCAIVRIEEVPICGIEVNCEARVANLLYVRTG